MSLGTDADLASDLLAYLRVELEAPSLRYASPPMRFGAGVENRVYSLQLANAREEYETALVLRLYRAVARPVDARIEAAFHTAVAEQGFPAPPVVHICEDATVLGAPFMLMRRLPGRVMLEPLASTGAGFVAPLRNWRGLLMRMPVAIADVMSSLHSLDPSSVRHHLRRAGVDPSEVEMDEHLRAIARRIDDAKLDGFREGMEWILRHAPPQPSTVVICHGDLWFGNVLQEAGHVTGLVDWSRLNARIADPAYDAGTTSVMLGGGMADIPGPLRFIGRRVQGRMSRRFLQAYRARRPLDEGALRYYQLVRCIDYLSFVAWRRLDASLRARGDRDMLDIPGSTEGLEAIFARATGRVLTMPSRQGSASGRGHGVA